jgi:hypothetical protein
MLAVLFVGAAVSCSRDSVKLTYYVQLVRGSNDAQPPDPGSTAIGPKVAAQLRPVIAWRNLWEMSRQEASVGIGEKTRMQLNPRRGVEIDLTTKGRHTVVAYSDGQAGTSMTCPIGQRMTIIGGDRDKESSWFIIVRRDKPPN